MAKGMGNQASKMFEYFGNFLRKGIFSVLSVGCVPNHIAFIMDGNKKYAKKWNLLEGTGHKVGYLALMNMLKYYYELGVKYVTIYGFSIDNFKRHPKEVQSTMQLIQEKNEDLIMEESMVNHYGVRLYFLGNLKFLSKPMSFAAERAIVTTAGNSKVVLSICLAYTSSDEILHVVQLCCKEKWDEGRALESKGARNGLISVRGNKKDESKRFIMVNDVEKHMYAAVAPHPDIIIHTSSETWLSNFLFGKALIAFYMHLPYFGPRLVFGIWFGQFLDFQRNFSYLKEKTKQS